MRGKVIFGLIMGAILAMTAILFTSKVDIEDEELISSKRSDINPILSFEALPSASPIGGSGIDKPTGALKSEFNSVEDEIYCIFRAAGASDAFAAGILGNIYAESGFQPYKLEHPGETPTTYDRAKIVEHAKKGSNGCGNMVGKGGVGLMQLTDCNFNGLTCTQKDYNASNYDPYEGLRGCHAMQWDDGKGTPMGSVASQMAYTLFEMSGNNWKGTSDAAMVSFAEKKDFDKYTSHSGNTALNQSQYWKGYTTWKQVFEETDPKVTASYIYVVYERAGRNTDSTNPYYKNWPKGKRISVAEEFYQKYQGKYEEVCLARNSKPQGAEDDGKGIRIVLDAGHGGKDKGAVAGDVYEKDLNLEAVTIIGNYLKSKGYIVNYTRTIDEYIDLEEIPKRAAKYTPDIFISMHYNSVDGAPSTSGVETFGRKKDKESNELASAITKAIADRTGQVLRSNTVHSGDLKVIHSVNTTKEQFRYGVLVEGGFMTNSTELALISTDAHRQHIAEAIHEAIQSLNIKRGN